MQPKRRDVVTGEENEREPELWVSRTTGDSGSLRPETFETPKTHVTAHLPGAKVYLSNFCCLSPTIVNKAPLLLNYLIRSF